MAGGAGGSGGGAKRDVREELEDMREGIQAATDAKQSEMYSAFPVEFTDWDSKQLTAKVQPLIKARVRNSDGKVEKVELPEIHDVPIYYTSASQYIDTVPINNQGDQGGGSSGGQGGSSGGQGGSSGGGSSSGQGGQGGKKKDEGIAIISSRSIDRWHKESGVQDQVTSRMFDMSDAMVLPGVKSLPRAKDVKGGVSKVSAQWRTLENKSFHDLDEKKGLRHQTDKEVNTKADENINNETQKSIQNKTEENVVNEVGKVHQTQAKKAIVKKAPKIVMNSG